MGRYRTWFLAFLAFILPLALYVKTLAPTYIPIDSAEFVLCMRFWGICHPPGFPLYVFLGKIFVDFWPFGTLIYKANLVSAIFGALTSVFVYLVLRDLKVSAFLAFALSIFLAISQTFWEFSTAADVFTFSTFLLILMLFFTFKRWRYLAFFTLGLSASHFYISAVLWPLLLWFFATNATNGSYWSNTSNMQRLKLLFFSAGFFALGFFPQVIMYFRMQTDPEVNWGHALGISGFLDFVRRREFGSIFLIANPVLTFSLFKVFKHFWVYFQNLFVQFGIILPIIGVLGLFFNGLVGDRKMRFLIFSYIALVFVQLVLLSTIDPLDKNSPFQINKFYLSSFIFAILIFGAGVEVLTKRIFENGLQAAALVFVLVAIYFFANFRVNDYSNNYFSQNLVLDALSQLPDDSIAITVGHVFYFGGLYEQKINGKFKGVSLLYFPNEKNRDSEKYQPRLFEKQADVDFVSKVSKDKKLGRAESYILEVISRNLDKPIFILQGTFEEKFFTYLKPHLSPYGLWWKVERDSLNRQVDARANINLLVNLKNEDVVTDDLYLRQQKDDLLTYAVSYNSAGVYMASGGLYNEALAMFRKSLEVNGDAKNVGDEIDLVGRTKQLEGSRNSLILEREKEKLFELGNNLFTLGNYPRCAQVFEEMGEIWAGDAQIFNNAGSCFANYGEVDLARTSYQKALEVDPNLEKARIGLEEIGE